MRGSDKDFLNIRHVQIGGQMETFLLVPPQAEEKREREKETGRGGERMSFINVWVERVEPTQRRCATKNKQQTSHTQQLSYR